MSIVQKIKQKKRQTEDIGVEELKQGLKSNWQIPALMLLFLLALYLRYLPAKGMPYLQAADPYYIFRMSQHIALEGHLPQLDFMRYFPYATPNYTVQLGELLVPALLYNAGFSLFFENYLEWAQFYPALMGSLTVIVMYFLGKELFDKETGLAAAFFLAVTSSSLRRASAGFFEKEPLGTFLMIVSLLFFTRAWKNESWTNGILSGLSLGLFTISWGGSQMLWLLYPILTGVTLFLNIETRKLITSYTPTILIAAGFAAASNPSRFWFTDTLFLISTAVLGTLWLRYLAEELNLIQDKYLSYFVPTLSIIGVIAAIISPLYSQWLASKLIKLVNVATGNTGNSVVGQTVQENAAPGIGDLATSLGNILFGNLHPLLDSFTILVSPWTFMIASITLISTTLLLMLGKKYDIIEGKIPGKKNASYTQAVFTGIMIFTAGLLINKIVVFALVALITSAILFTVVYYLEGSDAFNITTMMLGGIIIGLFILDIGLNTASTAFTNLTMIPTLAALITSLTLYKLDHFPQKTMENQWILFVPLIYILSNVYGGTTRSRLVFLSTFAVALGAGHGLRTTIKTIQKLDYTKIENLKPEKAKIASAITVLTLVVGINFASGYIMSQNITGSPSPEAPLSKNTQVWQPSLDYMNNQTDPGDVILSWWDYGYSFQTLGRSAAQADGGNLRYYGDTHQNQFLANYLNSTTRNDTEFLEKHSADYIWLDYTMIGKFAPVSQIANNDNQDFESISRFGVRNTQEAISRDGNTTVITTSKTRFRTDVKRDGRIIPVSGRLRIPLKLTNSSVSLNGAPEFLSDSPLDRERNTEFKITCTIAESGKTKYNISDSEVALDETQYFDSNYCVSEDPVYSIERALNPRTRGQSRFLMIPEQISDSTFVELYVQDGNQVDYAEKVNEASNGFIKMWEIEE